LSTIKELYRARDLITNLTRRELKSKYRATALGHLWSLANPLTIMLVYTVVFSYIMRVQPDRGDPSGLDIYALWLLCALLPWLFFTGTVNGGISTLIGNSGLIKKVAFPRSALIVSNSIALFITWCIEISVLLVALVIAGSDVVLFIPVLAIFMLLLALFATGVAMFLSIANAYFRDMQHFVTMFLQVWFFMTPVLYPITLVQQKSELAGPIVGPLTIYDFYRLNPMFHFASAFRNLLYDNRFPSLTTTALCVGLGVLTFTAGLWFFKRHEKGLAEAL